MEKFRIAKDDIQKAHAKIDELNYKLSEKEHEETVMRHSLQGVKDQLSFTQKDNDKYQEDHKALKARQEELLRYNKELACQLDFMIQMDEKMTQQIRMRNYQYSEKITDNAIQSINLEKQMEMRHRLSRLDETQRSLGELQSSYIAEGTADAPLQIH